MKIDFIEDFEFFEAEFIKRLFSEAIQTITKEDPGNLSIIILAGNQSKASTFAARKLSGGQCENYFVLSDEQLKHRFWRYRKAHLVLRNYFNPAWTRETVFTLPLGYHGDFPLQRVREATPKLRTYAWSFVGQIKQERQEMISIFETVGPSFSFQSAEFNDSRGLSGPEVFTIYSESHFVLCPFGNVSPDSFRVMEALQAGAIPVTIRFLGTDHNRLVFGDHPFIVATDWDNALLVVQAFLEDPRALRAKQLEVQKWYDRFMQNLTNDLGAILNGSSRDELESEQFIYQRLASRTLLVRIRYWQHYSPRAKAFRRETKELIDFLYIWSGLKRFRQRKRRR